MNKYVSFADNFKALRQIKGMTQAKIARELGIHRQTVNNWEKRNVTPDIETLKRIADLLECTVAYLLGNEKCEPPIHFFHDKQINEINQKIKSFDSDELKQLVLFIDFLNSKKEKQ